MEGEREKGKERVIVRLKTRGERESETKCERKGGDRGKGGSRDIKREMGGDYRRGGQGYSESETNTKEREKEMVDVREKETIDNGREEEG
jgi:hypothetical protein